MYRTAPPGQPAAPDPTRVVPGEGLRGILVGNATAEEVLATFGADARVSRHDDGDVFQISYDYTAAGEYQPSRPASAARPHAFAFEFGLLNAISLGVYQRDLHTDAGIRIGSTREEVLGAYGPACQTLTYEGPRPGPGDDIVTLRYRKRGLELGVHQDGRVASMRVFQTRRFA